MENDLRIVQYGLGPIGVETARLLLKRSGVRLVGGIDINPELVGQELGDILGLQRPLDVSVSGDADTVLRELKPDIVLHSTNSFLTQVEPQLMACIRGGASVISSCEELFYPFHRNASFCERIDAAARENDVVVVGTGVNPGFAMDVLALAVSGACTEVRRVEVLRVADAARRRRPLQKKVGAGLTPVEFRKLVAAGKLGHIGLLESLYAVADRMGFQVDEVQETIEPKLAETAVKTEFLEVAPGAVAGIVHIARGFEAGEQVVLLELQMYVGAEDELDRVRIEGEPPVDLRIEGGIFGDSATTARMVNAVPAVQRAAPGLRTIMDLPLTTYFR